MPIPSRFLQSLPILRLPAQSISAPSMKERFKHNPQSNTTPAQGTHVEVPDTLVHGDEFKAKANCVVMSYQISIFNRWGNIVFESTDPTVGWDGQNDGKSSLQETYIWVMNMTILSCNGEQIGYQESGDLIMIK